MVGARRAERPSCRRIAGWSRPLMLCGRAGARLWGGWTAGCRLAGVEANADTGDRADVVTAPSPRLPARRWVSRHVIGGWMASESRTPGPTARARSTRAVHASRIKRRRVYIWPGCSGVPLSISCCVPVRASGVTRRGASPIPTGGAGLSARARPASPRKTGVRRQRTRAPTRTRSGMLSRRDDHVCARRRRRGCRCCRSRESRRGDGAA